MSAPSVQVPKISNAEAIRNLYLLYQNTEIQPRALKKKLEQIDAVYGYDLVVVIALIMKSGLSGYLNIISQANELSGLVFSDGDLVKIDIASKETNLVSLLIDEKVLTLDQIAELKKNKKNTDQVAEILKSVTSEQINAVMLKQMRLKLSRYIGAIQFKFNFSEDNIETVSNYRLSFNDLNGLFHDWIAGCFDESWLSYHFKNLSKFNITVHPPLEAAIESGRYDLLIFLRQIKLNLTSGMKLSTIKTWVKRVEDLSLLYKCLHFAILNGWVGLTLDPEHKKEDAIIFEDLLALSRANKGFDQLTSMSEYLKIQLESTAQFYHAVNKLIENADKVDPTAKNKLLRVVLDILSQQTQFDKYISQLNHTSAVPSKSQEKSEIQKIKSQNLEPVLINIKKLLLSQNHTKAKDLLLSLKPHEDYQPRIKLYFIWLTLVESVQTPKKIQYELIDKHIWQILPEDKNSADYYYVMALKEFMANQNQRSDAFYNKALALDSQFKDYPLPEGGVINKWLKKLF